MPIAVIDKIKQKAGDFKLLDASDINWDSDIPADKLPQDLATKDDVTNAITDAVGKLDALHREVLAAGSELPAEGDANTIYMLPKGDGTYTEYMYVNGSWEILGSNDVDLSNYATTSDVSDAVSAAKTELQAYSDTSEADAIEAARQYTDQEKVKYLPTAGGTMTGRLTGILDPTNDSDAVNKKYVDAAVSGVEPTELLTESDFSTGTANGTFKVKDTEVAIAGLKSAAYMDASEFVSPSRLQWIDIG